MAQQAGLLKKNLYTIPEVAKATGVPYSTLLDEAAAGRLQTLLPPGRRRGRLVKPEWFDAWFAEGVRGA